MRVTILRPNVFNAAGILLPVGSTNTVSDDYGRSLVQSLQASDTDSFLSAPQNAPFSTAPVSTAVPVNGAAVNTLVAQQVSDQLPTQIKTVLATGQVVAGPVKVSLIRCLTAGAITLRDVVTQTQAGTDTTSPAIYPTTTLAIGDQVRVQVEAFTGLHATVTGTFELEI